MERLIKKILTRVLILSFLIIGFLFFYKDNPKPYILGYIFGTAISILNFLLLKNSVEKSVKMTESRAQNYATGQYFIRMGIFAVTILIGAVANYLSLITTLFGVLIIKIVIYLSNFFDRNFLQ